MIAMMKILNRSAVLVLRRSELAVDETKWPFMPVFDDVFAMRGAKETEPLRVELSPLAVLWLARDAKVDFRALTDTGFCINFPGIKLECLDLRGADLSGAYLHSASLRGSDLSGATLEWATLIGADFRDATLSGASVARADLRWACLRGADLTEVDFDEAILSDAYLDGSNLKGANLAKLDMRRATLYGADLTGANLTDADLTGATIYRRDSIYCRDSNKNIENIVEKTIFDGAVLTGAIRTADDEPIEGWTLHNGRLQRSTP